VDQGQQSRAHLIDDLLTLCRQITALDHETLTPAWLDEVASVALLHADSIVNTLRVPLVVLDATLHVLMANRYFYTCFQATSRETEGHLFYALGNGQWNIPALRELLEQILPYHTAFEDFEVSHPFPHIGPKTMRLNARQIIRPSGAPPLILLAIEDITAHQRAATALRQQRDLLAVTLRSIGDAVITTDPHGRLTFLNPVAEALTGWPLQDALGQPVETVFQLVHEQTRQPMESPVVRVLREGDSVSSATQTVLITRDGRDVLIADSGAPIWSEAGTLHGLVLVFRDISARRHLEDQLRQAQKMQALGTLAGGVAHDFNNILMMILGYTELAQDDLPLDSPIRAHLQQVLTAGRRATALVRQILTFSRQTPVEWTPVSLTALLREILPFVQTLLPATIALEAHLPPEPCPVLANPTQMFQIVMNLGANAEYAMRATGGRLAVRLEPVEVDAALAATHPSLRLGPAVRLSVHDTGPGIPSDVLARIYEPFFTTKAVGHGTGLGLSVVHGIIADHGGTILVESTLGQGTTFTIYLPRLVEPNVEEARPTAAPG
jgi:two-component system cell cycle sensor histidine kinase/response regulator CckA